MLCLQTVQNWGLPVPNCTCYVFLHDVTVYIYIYWSMLSSICIYKSVQVNAPIRFSPGIAPASTTAAWAHLRALRDTGSTCHGTPDLGEGSSGALACQVGTTASAQAWNSLLQIKEVVHGNTCHRCADMYKDPDEIHYSKKVVWVLSLQVIESSGILTVYLNVFMYCLCCGVHECIYVLLYSIV